MGFVLGSVNAAVDVGSTIHAKGRGGDVNTAVTRSANGVGVIESANEVRTIPVRVSHGGWFRIANLGILVAWSGRGGDDAIGEMGVSPPSVGDIIFVEADAELLNGGSTATIVPIVSLRIDDALDVGEIAAVVWIG